VHRRDVVIVLGLIVLAVGLPAIVGIASGAIAIPHNDDFAYRRPALTLYQSGRLELTGWAVMTLIGQLAATLPLLWLTSGSSTAFAATTMAFAVVGIVAGYALARRVLTPGPAGLAVLLATLVPGFLLYTTAYMTEVPAFAMEVSCLAIGSVAIGRTPHDGRWRWLAASLAVGCYGFAIREYAAAAPIAVLLAAVTSDPERRWRPYAIGLGGVVGAFVAIYVFAAALPGQASVGLELPTPGTTRRVLDAVNVVSLALAPALFLAVVAWVPYWRRSDRRIPAAVGALAGVAAASVIYLDQLTIRLGLAPGPVPDVLVGNVFSAHGSLDVGVMAGSRPVLYAPPTWDLLNAFALLVTIAGIAFLGAFLVAERHRLARAVDLRAIPTSLGSTPGMLAAFVVVFAVGTAALGLTSILFDRYVWPLALPLAILLLRPPEPSSAAYEGRSAWRRVGVQILAGVLVVVVATTSLALLLNEAAFDGARWRMGEEAVRLGFAPDTVDAGLEWVGIHATGLAALTAPPEPSGTDYSVKFPSFHPCAVVSSTALGFPGFRLLVARPDAYRLLLIGGPSETLRLYGVVGRGCPLSP
jgi:Dolichyl-phosphate-mannose-protein mannosyltransferase